VPFGLDKRSLSKIRNSDYRSFIQHNFWPLFLIGTGIVEVTLIKKILVIDDNNIFCNAIKNHLSQKEYDVKICISYAEFQDKIDIREFDLILLDLRLKDAKGLDILQYISEINPNQKVIIVSSYLDNENISQAKELGAYKCINKNSNLFNELNHIIDTL
jgi:DNA-binding NtrC family response regulator